ncbi:gamma-aminobutyric acid receptor subunit epsilon [Talpa occidentalis]|uniref:gamma-aminobutyric acid receptor subunit epsilon n=1 Tax=Talpa occidentalis TaxID=50954 RepID=UPI00188E5543|nr:gamma-aminobutyric acid receptor subunit epsilon [Talpa occidentalis]
MPTRPAFASLAHAALAPERRTLRVPKPNAPSWLQKTKRNNDNNNDPAKRNKDSARPSAATSSRWSPRSPSPCGPKLVLILLGLAVLFPSGIKGPHVEGEKESPAPDDHVYGPQLPGPVKLPPEDSETTAVGLPNTDSQMPSASEVLDSILRNYDHRLRPGIGERPTVVSVRLSVNTLGPISIMDMEYSIDITFYQTWYDERLRYNSSLESLVLSGNLVSQLWIPDTFFRNSKRVYEQLFSEPSQMVRIHRDGKVLYTIRMGIDAGCALHMFKYPLDSHTCPLSFSSFSYPQDEMIYKWEDFELEINEENSWKLFQFEFTGVSNKSETLTTISGDYIVLTLFFNVTRRFGFVAFQNYVPSSVTTMLSWVSFWIKKDSAPARTSLGITSVLTMTTLGSFTRKHFPRVSYITALDFYIAVCFVFCFCALMEFAVLNFLTYNQTRSRRAPKLRHVRAGSAAASRSLTRARAARRAHTRALQQEAFVCQVEEAEEEEEQELQLEHLACPAQQSLSLGSTRRTGGCCKWYHKYLCMVPCCQGGLWQKGRLYIHVYRLDNYSRVLFPVTFFFFNVLYWLVCLNL